MNETSVVQRQLRPFWGRVVILDSPVDEEERESGLIVRLLVESEQAETIRRGVVAHIDQTYHDNDGQWSTYARQINTGTVVYFKNGYRIHDVWVVDISDVLALEADT